MAVALRGAAVVPAGNPTTSFTVVIPASVQAGDVLFLAVTSRNSLSSTPPSITDDDTGGNAWAQVTGSSDHRATVWYKRATSGTASKTITASSLSNSGSGVLKCFSGATSSEPPYADANTETNVSGNESHAAFTPTNADSMVCCSVHNYANDNAVTSLTWATLGATTMTEKLSTGGSDCATAFGHLAQVGAAADTGALTWAQTDGTTYSTKWSIAPVVTVIEEADGASAGTGGTSIIGAAFAGTVADSDGIAVPAAVASALSAGVTSATGVAAVTGLTSAFFAGVTSSTGAAAVAATSAATAGTVASSSGVGTAASIAASFALGTGSSNGTATPSSIACAFWLSTWSSTGLATVDGQGEAEGSTGANGVASGAATVTGIVAYYAAASGSSSGAATGAATSARGIAALLGAAGTSAAAALSSSIAQVDFSATGSGATDSLSASISGVIAASAGLATALAFSTDLGKPIDEQAIYIAAVSIDTTATVSQISDTTEVQDQSDSTEQYVILSPNTPEEYPVFLTDNTSGFITTEDN